MRRFLLVAAAAAIALVGLSANQCGQKEEAAPEQPAQQQETPPPAEQPATPPSTPSE